MRPLWSAFDVDQRRELSFRSVSIPAECSITVGREADLDSGVAPPDVGVSRLAMTVTWSQRQGWHLDIQNRNGAVVFPCGLSHMWVDARTELTRNWPRLGVRLVGSERVLEHWVLLETPGDGGFRGELAAQLPGPTSQPDLPRPLTKTQTSAVHAVFREFLAWPPISGAAPVPLAAAANRLGVSATAVHERLVRVRERAYALGLHQRIGVSDPGYVHLLVRYGYIRGPYHADPDSTTVGSRRGVAHEASTGR